MTEVLRFNWDTLAAIIGGASAIDIPRLNLQCVDEATAFLRSYGFDWADESHRDEVELLRQQSLEFLHVELLAGLPLNVPLALADERDVRVLMVRASGPPGEDQRWACAVLRVMHTVAHAGSHLNDYLGQIVREQIIARFHPHLFQTETGQSLGEGDEAIPLRRFELKHTKPLHSMVMKLLHKPENVATDIFDRIGVRFVTEERLDALRVVRYLRAHHVFSFPNIKPSRSRNTLIDLDWVRAEIARVDEDIRSGALSPERRLGELRRRTRSAPYAGPPEVLNPHSSVAYHALQITCREHVRIPGGTLGIDAPAARFFFPYEIQILDEASYQGSRSGLAAHDEYKARQRDLVRRRVLGALLGAA